MGIFDEQHRCLEVNDALLRIFGYTREEITGMPGTHFMAPESRELAKSNAFSEYSKPYEAIMIRKNGSKFPALIQGTNLIYHGKPIRVKTYRDITKSKKTQRELELAHAELDTIFSNSMIGIALLNRKRIIQRANKCFSNILGYDTPEEVEGISVSDFHLSPEQFEEFGKHYTTTIMQKGVVWIVEDITKRKKAEKQLVEMATIDSLTGTNNQRHFFELGRRELAGHTRHTRSLSVLMLDIDHFKFINDTMGHAAGDEALKAFSSICRDNLRTTDIIGRIGGEEFAIILSDTGMNQARDAAERIRRAVEISTASSNQEIPAITVSIGIATATPEDTLDTLIQHADSKLYLAKKNGRNRIESDK